MLEIVLLLVKINCIYYLDGLRFSVIFWLLARLGTFENEYFLLNEKVMRNDNSTKLQLSQNGGLQ